MIWAVQIKIRVWCKPCKGYHERWALYAVNSVFADEDEALAFAETIFPDHQQSVRVVDITQSNPEG